jgi:hypothetical protein
MPAQLAILAPVVLRGENVRKTTSDRNGKDLEVGLVDGDRKFRAEANDLCNLQCPLRRISSIQTESETSVSN